MRDQAKVKDDAKKIKPKVEDVMQKIKAVENAVTDSDADAAAKELDDSLEALLAVLKPGKYAGC